MRRVALVLSVALAALATNAAEAQSFTVRGAVGLGYGRGEAPDLRVEGIGLMWSVAPGLDLDERFGVHLELWGTSLEHEGPSLIVQDDPGRYDVFGTGLGASVLFPLDLRLSASAGTAFARAKRNRVGESSGWGWGASVRIDRSARVGRHAALGAGALFSYVHAFDAVGPRGFSVGLALDATFD